MVSTPLVLTALFLLLILQIITLIRVERVNARVFQKQNTNKNVSAHKSSKKEFNTINKRKDKKQPSRQRSKEKPPVSSVDKSLRDINLRLKNAERDQEKARRRLNENNGKGSGKKSKYNKPKKNNKNRNEISRDKRNFSRDKVSSGSPVVENEASPPPAPQKPLETPPIQDKVVSVPDNGNSNVSEPSFGRGNKITVKRRTLNKPSEETPDKQPVLTEENLQTTQDSVISEPPSDSQEVKTDTEDQKISFGRR